ncbi:FAXC protein, partial [Pseudoatta argentina]
MTMATETENNGPESKEIKDVKEMKEALKDDAPPDNKQEEKDAAAKKDEAAGKKDDDAAAAAGAATAPAKASTVHHPDYEKDVVYLYQFPRTPRLPSLSPYGLKVETWLRLNGIKYEKVRTLLEKHIPPASKSHLLGKNSKKSTLKRCKNDEDTRQKNGDETIGH